jgi:hypothetical protein
MAPKRKAAKKAPPKAPPPSITPSPALIAAVLGNPLIMDEIFLKLPTIEDRISLASTCRALRTHAYRLGPRAPLERRLFSSITFSENVLWESILVKMTG